MASLGLLGLYALSRTVAGKKQREREEKARQPITYVRVGNETMEFDATNPDHKNAPRVGVLIGNTFVQEPETQTPAVRDPVSKEPVTIDQYRSRILDNLERVVKNEPEMIGDETTGFPTGYDPIKIRDSIRDPRRIAIPQVIGNISSRGAFKPIQTGAVSKNTVVGGYNKGKFTGWMSLTDYSIAYPNVKPTLQAEQEGNSITGVDKFKGLDDTTKNAMSMMDKGTVSPTFNIMIKDKNKKDQVHSFNFASENTTSFGQLQDIHSQFNAVSHHFKDLDPRDPKVEKLLGYLMPLLVKESEIKSPEVVGEGFRPQVNKNYVDASEFLKGYSYFKNIPGIIPALQFAQSRISRKTFERRLNNISATDNKKIMLGTAKVKNQIINFDIAYPKTLNKDGDLEKTASLVVNDLANDKATQEEKNAVLAPFIEYEYNRNNFGDIIDIKTDEGGIKIPKSAANQHALVFFNSLRVGAAKTGFQYAVFKKLVQPRGYTLKTEANDELGVKTKYATMIASQANGYQIGHKLIMAFQDRVVDQDNSSLEDKIYDSLNRKQQVSNKTQNDFYADAENKEQYAATTIRLLKLYKGTYFLPDGTPLDISTSFGNLVMAKDGVLYWVDKMKEFAGSFVDDDPKDKFQPIKNTQDLQGKELTEASILGSISEGFYKRSEFGKSDSLYAQRQKELRTIAAGFKSSKEKTRALAQRAYYRMMIAYQMAAAIQGGTGGRTISDQDVDNILKALGGASLLSTPAKELAGIEAAMTLMQDIYQFNKHMSGSQAEKNAALKHMEFITEGNPNGVSRSPMVLNGLTAATFIANARGDRRMFGGMGAGGDQKTTNVNDADVLQSYNTRQEINGGKIYSSVDELKKAIGNTSFESERQKIIKIGK